MITTWPSYYNLVRNASNLLFLAQFSKRGNYGIPAASLNFQPTSPDLSWGMLQDTVSTPFNASQKRNSSHNWSLTFHREANQESKKCDRLTDWFWIHRQLSLFLFFFASVSHLFMPWLEFFHFASSSFVNLVLVFKETAIVSSIKVTEGNGGTWLFGISNLGSEELFTTVMRKVLYYWIRTDEEPASELMFYSIKNWD